MGFSSRSVLRVRRPSPLTRPVSLSLSLIPSLSLSPYLSLSLSFFPRVLRVLSLSPSPHSIFVIGFHTHKRIITTHATVSAKYGITTKDNDDASQKINFIIFFLNK